MLFYCKPQYIAPLPNTLDAVPVLNHMHLVPHTNHIVHKRCFYKPGWHLHGHIVQ